MNAPSSRSCPAGRLLGLSLGLLLPALSGGCSGAGWPKVLDPSDIVDIAEGTPRIARVRDLGTLHIGRDSLGKPVAAESDGQFTVGELMLVEGSGFGKLPTLQLGGRPVDVLWRAAGGGVIARVPPGVSAGPQPLRLAAGGKQAETTVVVRRLGLLLDLRRGALHSLLVAGGPGAPPQLGTVGQPLPLPGARAVALGPSGAAAYVLGGGARGRVTLVDLGAPGGPRPRDSRDLSHGAFTAAAAERAAAVAFVGEAEVTLWDVSDPMRPAPYPAVKLPEEARGARMAALDASGTLLALGMPEGNRVVLCDLRPGPQGMRPVLRGEVLLLPQARQPLLADLRFAPDGETLWALSGDRVDGAAEARAGHQPTRLHQIRVEAGEGGRSLALDKSVEVADAGAPVQLQIARALPVVSGATIRTPPEKATLFLSTVTAEALGGGEPAGALLRSDASGQSSALYSGAEVLGGVDLTPDGAVAVVGQARQGREGLAALVAHTEMVSTLSVPLGAADSKDLRPPLPSTRVAVQP